MLVPSTFELELKTKTTESQRDLIFSISPARHLSLRLFKNLFKFYENQQIMLGARRVVRKFFDHCVSILATRNLIYQKW